MAHFPSRPLVDGPEIGVAYDSCPGLAWGAEGSRSSAMRVFEATSEFVAGFLVNLGRLQPSSRCRTKIIG